MKHAIAALITFAILAAVLFFTLRNPAGNPPSGTVDASADRAPFRSTANSGPTPEDCIQRMFESAERGDVVKYIDCFTGAEREQLDRQLSDQSEQAFSESLMQAIKQMKGHAVHQAEIQNGRAELVVERVYASRNERQRYELLLGDGQWRIATVHRAEPFQPEIPYGTPVYQEPEQ